MTFMLKLLRSTWYKNIMFCSAKTRLGTKCQKPPIKGKKRCRLHGGLSSGGFWHAVPRRVRAPHRWPGQSGPKCHGMPFSRLLFFMLKSLPHMGFIITHYWWRCEGWVARSVYRGPSKTIQCQLSSSKAEGEKRGCVLYCPVEH